jgi:hypothetical protein
MQDFANVAIPQEPALEATQRADEAYEDEDMLNFWLWPHVTRAMEKLLQTRPQGAPSN